MRPGPGWQESIGEGSSVISLSSDWTSGARASIVNAGHSPCDGGEPYDIIVARYRSQTLRWCRSPNRKRDRRSVRETTGMTSRRNTRLAAAGAWMMAWSALAGAARIALGGPQDPVRVEGIVTYTGPPPDPIPITEAGTVRRLIEIEPKTKGLKDAVVWLDGTPAAGKPTTLSK